MIYLVFNEGYAATAGERWLRPELLEEALRLGRILAELIPDEAEVHGLVALMELQASRARARIGPGGAPVLLLDQDRSRWDWMLVRRGLAALERAYATGGALGPVHAAGRDRRLSRPCPRRRGHRLGAHRRALRRPRPAHALAGRRAQPRGRGRHGARPGRGARTGRGPRRDPALRDYHLLPTVRGDLLEKLGRSAEAGRDFQRAAALTGNARERAVLLGRMAACASRNGS